MRETLRDTLDDGPLHAGFNALQRELNARVADQTKDRIDDLLPEGALDELTRLVLQRYLLPGEPVPSLRRERHQ